MSLELANLRFNRVIAHEVHERAEDGQVVAPRYSTALTDLSPEGMSALADRVIQAIGDASHSIEMEVDEDSEGSTFQSISQLLGSRNEDFLALSRTLADRLTVAQKSRRIPGGIVVIFDGVAGAPSRRIAGVIKAETHDGFSSSLDQSGGPVLRFVSNLLLTPQQKLYKIGLFVEKSDSATADDMRSPEDFDVYIYDHNMTRTESRQAAIYYYEGFLGCRFTASSKKMTQEFFTSTRHFIEESSLGPAEKSDLHQGLYVYLKVQQTATINVREFSEQYVPEDLRDSYENLMADKVPTRSFDRDLSYIDSRLRRRKMRFSSRINVQGPADRFSEVVQIVETGDMHTLLKIEGKVLDQE